MMRKFSLKPGNIIEIPTPSGFKRLTIKAVYADYSNETGTVMVNRKFIERFYNDKSVTNVAVYLNPETDANSRGSIRFKKNFQTYLSGRIKS